ncbi:uncharacterized protein EI90DRAFT_3124500 [Cantharellus anzutake]|uniref:uncharacterized protein n=1 Tax=Cantharellus anzutake TaxID=1750568 RepID=UPI00190695B3|nr:uncharacterized protein EI90DRAFT_3124500 [Cantharellus anzutake]KAF8330410.1 hypothetical protein EI90DRAFT_3124500 [Cantharellus anzutake]
MQPSMKNDISAQLGILSPLSSLSSTSSSLSSRKSSLVSHSPSIASFISANTALRSSSLGNNTSVRHRLLRDEEALTNRLNGLIESAQCCSTRALEEGVDEVEESEFGDEDHPTGLQELPPLVILEGFLSFVPRLFWGGFDKYFHAYRDSLGKKRHRKLIIARVGPVSSLHDRACELFYSIKGGTVDYGEAHSRSSHHTRYGRHYATGAYPAWSKWNPVHFATHSLGGTTVAVMLQLMKEGHFGFEDGIHPDMVASFSAVSAPFKGTGIVHVFGKDGKGALSSIYLFISFWMFLRQMWRSDWEHNTDSYTFDSRFEGAVGREQFWNRREKVAPATYFRSYVACMTRRANPEATRHVISWKSHVLESIIYYCFAQLLGNLDYQSIRTLPSFLKPQVQFPPSRANGMRVSSGRCLGGGSGGLGNSKELGRSEMMLGHALNGAAGGSSMVEEGTGDDLASQSQYGRTGVKVDLPEDYYASDGLVPLFSQYHPGDCSPTYCIHHSSIQNPHTGPGPFHFGLSNPSSTMQPKPKPGIWNVCYMQNTTHLSIMPLWRGSRLQRAFWSELGEWLEVVDEARRERDVERKRKESAWCCNVRPSVAPLSNGTCIRSHSLPLEAR